MFEQQKVRMQYEFDRMQSAMNGLSRQMSNSNAVGSAEAEAP